DRAGDDARPGAVGAVHRADAGGDGRLAAPGVCGAGGARVRRGCPVKLSVAMIVRDEEQMLPGCLAELGRCERVIVDTGSRDRTREIAARSGARVFDFAWCDDFSAARNFALAQCTGDWVLVLDADERVSSEL